MSAGTASELAATEMNEYTRSALMNLSLASLCCGPASSRFSWLSLNLFYCNMTACTIFHLLLSQPTIVSHFKHHVALTRVHGTTGVQRTINRGTRSVGEYAATPFDGCFSSGFFPTPRIPSNGGSWSSCWITHRLLLITQLSKYAFYSVNCQ